MSTFKLGKVEFLQQSEGLSSAIKLQVSNLGLEECSSIPWDEFQVRIIIIIFNFFKSKEKMSLIINIKGI